MAAARLASGLPVELVNAFWDEVEESLRQHHHLSGDKPLRAIMRYRNELERVGGLSYHRAPSAVADGIVEGGYAEV